MTTQVLKLAASSKLLLANAWFQLLLFMIGGLMLGAIIVIKAKTAVDFWTSPWLYAYTIFVTTFQMSRLGAAMLYKNSNKNALAHKPLYEPSVTFVIPCKNEEAAIAHTIERCFAAQYPKNKLEVIVINDGSTDDTIGVLRGLARYYRGLTIVDWKENRGKRHAMAEGFTRARGEIIIQLDSDSYIDPATFSQIVMPFANNEIAAVCAHADPQNADENIITKMQAAYYFMSFRIMKAAESTFFSVFCCSGCSSAYRKSAVMPVLQSWLNESFMGLPVTWGDDRALTSWILREGHKTIYTDNVRAYTIVPNTLRKLLTQQLRWKKSWIINAIFTSKFIYKKYPFMGFAYFLPLTITTLVTPLIAFRALIYAPIMQAMMPVYYILGILCMTIMVMMYYRILAPHNKYWLYLIPWGVLNMFVLSFMLVYAAFRLQDRKWGTR